MQQALPAGPADWILFVLEGRPRHRFE